MSVTAVPATTEVTVLPAEVSASVTVVDAGAAEAGSAGVSNETIAMVMSLAEEDKREEERQSKRGPLARTERQIPGVLMHAKTNRQCGRKLLLFRRPTSFFLIGSCCYAWGTEFQLRGLASLLQERRCLVFRSPLLSGKSRSS